jgi:hypothetical protein
MATPGIYVIELTPHQIKVGLSKDTDKRLATHLRNARGLGHDPYRYRAFEVPEHLLRLTEKKAHKAILIAGGVSAPRSPEVFTGVYYNPVLSLVERVCLDICEYESAIERLAALSPVELSRALGNASHDVRTVTMGLLQENT